MSVHLGRGMSYRKFLWMTRGFRLWLRIRRPANFARSSCGFQYRLRLRFSGRMTDDGIGDAAARMTSNELKRWLAKQGCTFGDQEGSHLKVYLGDRQTVIPMHAKKEIKTGTMKAIKKALGLK